MSFHTIEQAPARLNRSALTVPDSQPQLFGKASKSDVDAIFLDLEDAVAPDEKEQARKYIIKALNEVDWGSKTMSIRINGLDTHYMYHDVVEHPASHVARWIRLHVVKQGGCGLEESTSKKSAKADPVSLSGRRRRRDRPWLCGVSPRPPRFTH